MYQQMSNAENQFSTQQQPKSLLAYGQQAMASGIPEREPEVKEQINILNIEVGELEGLIASLENKFESVLQSVPPQENGTDISACKRTRLGGQLHTLSLRLQTARSRIVSILDRAEV